MTLVAVPNVTYRCTECGTTHNNYPDRPCCQPSDPTDGLYTPADIAELAKVSKTTVNQWIAKGHLKAIRIGQVVRISPEHWHQFTRR